MNHWNVIPAVFQQNPHTWYSFLGVAGSLIPLKFLHKGRNRPVYFSNTIVDGKPSFFSKKKEEKKSLFSLFCHLRGLVFVQGSPSVHPWLDFSQISFVCLIAWFAWAGLIRLRGLPDLPEQDWSGWEGVPDLPEQDWSGWEECLICMSRIFGPAQKIRRSGKLPNFFESLSYEDDSINRLVTP